MAKWSTKPPHIPTSPVTQCHQLCSLHRWPLSKRQKRDTDSCARRGPTTHTWPTTQSRPNTHIWPNTWTSLAQQPSTEWLKLPWKSTSCLRETHSSAYCPHTLATHTAGGSQTVIATLGERLPLFVDVGQMVSCPLSDVEGWMHGGQSWLPHQGQATQSQVRV